MSCKWEMATADAIACLFDFLINLLTNQLYKYTVPRSGRVQYFIDKLKVLGY